MTLPRLSLTGRAARVAAVAAIVVGGTAGAAMATTASDARGLLVEFYFGETAGSGNSEHTGGWGIDYSTVVCSDAYNVSNNNYGVKFLHDRTLQPDDVLKDKLLSYNSAYYESATFKTSYNKNYHSYVSWSAVPSASYTVSGFTTARFAGC